MPYDSNSGRGYRYRGELRGSFCGGRAPLESLADLD